MLQARARKTMVSHATLQPIDIQGGAEIHLQPMENHMQEQVTL